MAGIVLSFCLFCCGSPSESEAPPLQAHSVPAGDEDHGSTQPEDSFPPSEEPAGERETAKTAMPVIHGSRTLRPSGLSFVVLQQSASKEHPAPEDAVVIDYTAWTAGGEVLSSTTIRGRPQVVPMRALLPGLAEALAEMAPGEKRRLWLPHELAHEANAGPETSDLVYDIQLVRIIHPPEVPEDVSSPPATARLTRTGLQTRVIRRGTGNQHPSESDTVRVHYSAWTSEGELLDSSILRDHSTSISVNRTMPAWQEALKLMVAGEIRRLWVPEKLSYGGRPGAPRGTMVFEIELLEILHYDSFPKDARAIPRNAERSASGLLSQVLTKGWGTRHPSMSSLVTIDFSGWKLNGQPVDSSLDRGRPSTLLVSDLIPGWSEGLRLMVEGEKRRFWIPQELAFNGRPGHPQGDLVYDLTLLAITDG